MDVVNEARGIFATAGFNVSAPMQMRSICFSFCARRDESFVIIRVLGNVDAFSRHSADELKTISEALGGNPLVIGEGTGSGPLEDGIIYTRFKIPIISLQTLRDHLLEDAPPCIFAAPGGLYVNIDSGELRAQRSARNVSLGALAEAAGVSRRTIQLYESGMGAMIDAALRLEEYLDTPLIESIDPFEYGFREREEERAENPEQSVRQTGTPSLDKMITIGYKITPIVKSPFDVVSRDDANSVVFLTGVDSGNPKLIERAITVSEISRISGRHSVYIVKNRRTERIENTALVSDDEITKIDDISDLNDLVLSRSTRR